MPRIQNKMKELLIEVASQGRCTNYKEIARKIPMDHRDPSFHTRLLNIALEENERGRGILPIIVGTKHNNNEPSDLFYIALQEAGYTVESYASELQKVWSYWRKA